MWVCSFVLYITYSDIHTTKYSGGHETFMKMFKSAGGGWQIFSKTLAGKEINEHQFFVVVVGNSSRSSLFSECVIKI